MADESNAKLSNACANAFTVRFTRTNDADQLKTSPTKQSKTRERAIVAQCIFTGYAFNAPIAATRRG